MIVDAKAFCKHCGNQLICTWIDRTRFESVECKTCDYIEADWSVHESQGEFVRDMEADYPMKVPQPCMIL